MSNAPESSANNTNNAGAANNNNNTVTPFEHNPRWQAYLYILIASLVNFSSVGNTEASTDQEETSSVLFGAMTFCWSFLIIVADRCFPCCCGDSLATKCFCNLYTKALDGKVEGYTLLFFCIWWMVGVAYQTRVGGLAYAATNIYFSSWLTWFCCIYTLNEWSTAKDILSIAEITSVSATLKSWWVLFLSSLVVMATCADLHNNVSEENKSSTAYGIIMGLISTCVSSLFILIHYNFITVIQQGGWLELLSSFAMILVWISGVATLTQENNIGATITGIGCGGGTIQEQLGVTGCGQAGEDCACYVIFTDQDNIQEVSTVQSVVAHNFTFNSTTTTVMFNDDRNERFPDPPSLDTSVEDILNDMDSSASSSLDPIVMEIPDPTTNFYSCNRVTELQVPGSNLYLGVWICLVASLHVTLRWKAAQAIQFAHAAQNKRELEISRSNVSSANSSNRNFGDYDDNDD